MKVLTEIVDEYGYASIQAIERDSEKDDDYEKILLKESKKNKLAELTKDFAQVQAGLIVPDIEQKKEEFRNLLNEIRKLEGKQPREISVNAVLGE